MLWFTIYYVSSNLSTLQILISALQRHQNERLCMVACMRNPCFLKESISISQLERLLFLASASLGSFAQISWICSAPVMIQSIHRSCSHESVLHETSGGNSGGCPFSGWELWQKLLMTFVFPSGPPVVPLPRMRQPGPLTMVTHSIVSPAYCLPKAGARASLFSS